MANNVTPLAPNARACTVYPSAARTATPDTAELGLVIGTFREGAVFVLDVTAVPGSAPSLVLKVEGVDRTTGKAWTILTGAAVTAVGTIVYRISPNLPPVANLTAQDILPPFVRVTITHGNANSVTYALGGNFS